MCEVASFSLIGLTAGAAAAAINPITLGCGFALGILKYNGASKIINTRPLLYVGAGASLTCIIGCTLVGAVAGCVFRSCAPDGLKRDIRNAVGQWMR